MDTHNQALLDKVDTFKSKTENLVPLNESMLRGDAMLVGRTNLSPEFQSWLTVEQSKGLVDVKASVDIVASDSLSSRSIADALMKAHNDAHSDSYKPKAREFM